MCLTLEQITRYSTAIAKDDKSNSVIYQTNDMTDVYNSNEFKQLSIPDQMKYKAFYNSSSAISLYNSTNPKSLTYSLFPDLDFSKRISYVIVGKSGMGKSFSIAKIMRSFHKANPDKHILLVTAKEQGEEPAFTEFENLRIPDVDSNGSAILSPLLVYVTPDVFMMKTDLIGNDCLWVFDDIIEMEIFSKTNTEVLDNLELLDSKNRAISSDQKFKIVKKNMIDFMMSVLQLGRARNIHIVISLHELASKNSRYNSAILKEATYVQTFFKDTTQLISYLEKKRGIKTSKRRELFNYMETHGGILDYDYLIHACTYNTRSHYITRLNAIEESRLLN